MKAWYAIRRPIGHMLFGALIALSIITMHVIPALIVQALIGG